MQPISELQRLRRLRLCLSRLQDFLTTLESNFRDCHNIPVGCVVPQLS